MEALTFRRTPSVAMLRFLALLPLLAACAAPMAQTPAAPSASDLERAQGYALTDDGATFLFDASLYGLAPERVVVTGAFRGWSADMDDAAWALAPSGDGLWTLHVDDPAGVGLGPSVPFKFRIHPMRVLRIPDTLLLFRFWLSKTGSLLPVVGGDGHEC